MNKGKTALVMKFINKKSIGTKVVSILLNCSDLIVQFKEEKKNAFSRFNNDFLMKNHEFVDWIFVKMEICQQRFSF